MKKTTTKSNEDYLETILSLDKGANSVKSIDVANALGVSKPAVSVAMTELIEKGLVIKESYGDISLTEKGKQVAKSTQEKHSLIKELLLSLGVSEPTAEVECCKIEHILSNETLACIKKNLNKK